MTYIVTPLLGLAVTLLNLICPFLVLLALPFARWDSVASSDHHGIGLVQRGDLPGWLSWFSTPDERLPGGFYEPTVAAIHERWGKWVCSWYWLGVRNCLMGLAVWLGRPTTDYIPEYPLGFWQRGDVWRWSAAVGPLKFVTGYQVYKALDGTFQAAPVFTLKRV